MTNPEINNEGIEFQHVRDYSIAELSTPWNELTKITLLEYFAHMHDIRITSPRAQKFGRPVMGLVGVEVAINPTVEAIDDLEEFIDPRVINSTDRLDLVYDFAEKYHAGMEPSPAMYLDATDDVEGLRGLLRIATRNNPPRNESPIITDPPTDEELRFVREVLEEAYPELYPSDS